jgi:hypothetical protein
MKSTAYIEIIKSIYMKILLNFMKLLLLLPFALYITTNSVSAQTTGAPPNYPMKFSYIDQSGNAHDTLMNPIKFKMWNASGSYPAYVKWKSDPFAVLRSSIGGLGLFTDSVTTFSSGQTIGWLYYKTNSTGRFNLDYIQSNIGMFVNNSETPNMQIIQTSQGLSLQALQTIGPGTELTIRFRDLRSMFPNDPTVLMKMRHW